MTHQYEFQVVVVGAGVVGMSTALGLAKSGIKTLLIEKRPMQYKTLSEDIDARVYALNHKSKNGFERLGVWNKIRERCTPVQAIEVWEKHDAGKLKFDGHGFALPDISFIVEHQVIQQALLLSLSECQALSFQSGIDIEVLNKQQAGWQIVLSDGSTYKADVLLAADGAHSWVRSHLGYEYAPETFGQDAIVATVTSECSHDFIARQKFSTTGPLAFLPLFNERQCSIVWSQQKAIADELMALPEDAFCDRLCSESPPELGKLVACSKRYSFPLMTHHCPTYIGEAFAMLGDVIHTVHPLAGQGLNLGLADAALMTDILTQAHRDSRQLGTHIQLRRYERMRKGDNARMIQLMKWFHYGFTSSQPWLANIRQHALLTVNKHPLLKHFFIEKAMQRP